MTSDLKIFSTEIDVPDDFTLYMSRDLYFYGFIPNSKISWNGAKAHCNRFSSAWRLNQVKTIHSRDLLDHVMDLYGLIYAGSRHGTVELVLNFCNTSNDISL